MNSYARRGAGGLMRIAALSKWTTYRGVQMRSRLEADFARHLDSLGVAWIYEPAIYGPKGEGYLPDFQIKKDGRQVFLEVKPTVAQSVKAMRRMEVIWDTDPDALLIVVCAEGSRFYESLRGHGWRMFFDRWMRAA